MFKTPLVIFVGSEDDDMVSNSIIEADLEINNKEGDKIIIDQILKPDLGKSSFLTWVWLSTVNQFHKKFLDWISWATELLDK